MVPLHNRREDHNGWSEGIATATVNPREQSYHSERLLSCTKRHATRRLLGNPLLQSLPAPPAGGHALPGLLSHAQPHLAKTFFVRHVTTGQYSTTSSLLQSLILLYNIQDGPGDQRIPRGIAEPEQE
jgi:hypothetical protein